jgi:hypothetical protein
MTTTTAPTAAEIAAELCWRLSNSNAETECHDIAYNTWADDLAGGSFPLSVSFQNIATGERGDVRFTVTVTPAP